jgi:uncharacterized membrane protein
MSSSKTKWGQFKSHPIRITIAVIAIIATLSIALAIYKYNVIFSGGLSSQHQSWAEFGDFFGGVTSGIFAFLALLTLLVTLDVQHTELKETRGVLNRQKFEATFFELLKTLNEKMDSISNGASYVVQTGRELEVTGKTLMFNLSENIRDSLVRGNNTTLVHLTGYYEGAIWAKCPSLIEFYSIFVFIANYINNQDFSDDDAKTYNDLLASYINQDGLLLVISHSLSSIADENIKQIATHLDLVERISNQAVKQSLKSVINQTQPTN